MNRFIKQFLLFVLLLSMVHSTLFSQSGSVEIRGKELGGRDSIVLETDFSRALRALPDVVSVTPLSRGNFVQKLEVMFRQPLDHSDPGKGSFSQRFFVCHVGADRPTVIVTEGYGASYAANVRYLDEIAFHLNANIVVVEHRYFGPSTPSPRDWDYLTVENSMNDLHRINQAVRRLYPGKWISTGISKGGMTTIMYKTYFPEDTDAGVAYVAPVCFAVEDGRHEPFIERCATPGQHAVVVNFQREILERREEVFPLFHRLCTELELRFRIPEEEVYDLCVLEYSFAFWQWGTPVESVPATGSPVEELFKHWVTVSGPDYFAIKDEPSFYVQAARELGYYGYDTRPFEGLMKPDAAQKYLYRVMLPEDAQDIVFSPQVAEDIYEYLKNNDPRLIFVYGEYDPWSAVAVEERLFEGKENMMLTIEPGGSHRARIRTLPPAVRGEVWQRLEEWIK